jgi:exodeoxyribonuclease V alpha subunit
MSLLAALNKAGALRPLDHALAQSLRRLDADTPDEVLAAAALASLAVSQGHAGFDPAQPQRLVDAGLSWPSPEEWSAQLAASRWISNAVDNQVESQPGPLVWENGLLYLRRYREYERRLAAGLQRIGRTSVEAGDVAGLAGVFAQLFPGQGASVVQQADLFDAPSPQPSPGGRGGNSRAANLDSSLLPLGEGARRADEGRAQDLQARAAAIALRHNLLLVTGGPGTGKTTTITRLLVLLAAQAHAEGKPAPRVALAAPTGRAAERMAESLRNAVQQLPAIGIEPGLCEQLPSTGTTLHRLLGVIPDSPRFRHHADNPLPYDVVVVDEASMIDLPLMTKLVEAIADGTRLVLLGDPDQLPSVEAGDVLSAILRAAGDGQRISGEDARVLQPLLGEVPAPAIEQHANAFAGARVQLQRGYRQSEALQLAPLATAMRQGDAVQALALLREGSLAGVHFHEGDIDPLTAWRGPLQQYWEALTAAGNPAEALALTGRLRLLTAVREGPQGARGLNARIEERLAGVQRRGSAGPGYFHGRLLIITENSYRHRLFNGDIGICLSDGGSRATTAWFPGDDPLTPRAFHPAALPAHESAFAMTVHKAQGSEFDQVWLQLPRRDNRVLSRELLYTGITRARHGLHLSGSAEVIEAALARHASRWSGLAWRLG